MRSSAGTTWAHARLAPPAPVDNLGHHSLESCWALPMQIRSFDELLAEGLSRSELRAHVRTGRLVRVRRGFYRGYGELTPEERHRCQIMAFLRSRHAQDCVVSHVSAAVLHGMPTPPGRLGEVCVIRPSRHSNYRQPGILHVRNAPLDDDEVVWLDGIPVTSIARTTVDLIRLWRREAGVALADHALRHAERDELRARVDERPCRGNSRARWALDFADPRSESYYESVTRVRMHEEGVPPPDLQVDMVDDQGHIGRTDYRWEEHRLLGEYDGEVKYGRLLKPGESVKDVFQAEKAREQRMCRQGWVFVRFVTADCLRPGAVGQLWHETLRGRHRLARL